MSQKHGAMLAIVVSTLVGLFLVEVGTRYFIPEERYIFGDNMWKHNWNTFLNNPERPAGVFMRTPFDMYDEQLGWKSKPQYSSETISTNSIGLRGVREYEMQKKEGEKRIAIFGDSFTFGWDARDEEVFARKLEEGLKDIPVLNFGVHGFGLDQQYLYYQYEGAAHAPDVVIFAVYLDDLDRALLSFRDYPKPQFKLRKGELALTNTQVPPAPTALITKPWFELSFFTLLADSFQKLKYKSPFAPLPKLADALFTAIKQEVEKNNAHFMIVVIPESITQKPDKRELFLTTWAEKNDVPVVNLREVFLKLSPEDQVRVYAEHFTPYGNEVTARALQTRLEELRWLE